MEITILEKFEKKVYPEPNTGCFLWDSVGIGRYGMFQYQNKSQGAHRVSYQLYKGEIPKGMCVCHICDQPSCVNPDHLFLGTHQENTQDMLKKNRSPRGSKSKNAKLTEADVISIRESYSKGIHTYESLAKEYGVARITIYRALSHINWKNV